MLSYFLGKDTAEYKFICSNCNKRYKYKGNLHRHMEYECGIEPKFPCPLCNYKGKQKTTLQMHIATIHRKSIQNFQSIFKNP